MSKRVRVWLKTKVKLHERRRERERQREREKERDRERENGIREESIWHVVMSAMRVLLGKNMKSSKGIKLGTRLLLPSTLQRSL